MNMWFKTSLFFCVLLVVTGCDATEPGEVDGSAPHELAPIQMLWTVHVEGWEDEPDDAESFNRHVSRLEAMRAVIEEYGLVANWEIRTDQFLAAVVNHDSDVIDTWIAAGHGVEIHADVGGSHDDDMRLQNEVGRRVQEMVDFGLSPVSVSGVCSEADWVSAVAHSGLGVVTSIVDYCLKSLPISNLPAGYDSVADCTTPSECHDAMFRHDLARSFTPWRPVSAEDWTVEGGASPMPILLLSGPFPGSVRCMAEEEGVQGSDCVLTSDDVRVLAEQVDMLVAARRPGAFHAFNLAAASIGGVMADGFEEVAAYLSEEIRLGNLESVTAQELARRYADWEASR